MIEKLRELMDDYKIQMILFVHPDLGIVQLDKDRDWYIQGRKSNKEMNKLSKLSKLVSKLEKKIINENYEDLLLIIQKLKEGI